MAISIMMTKRGGLWQVHTPGYLYFMQLVADEYGYIDSKTPGSDWVNANISMKSSLLIHLFLRFPVQ